MRRTFFEQPNATTASPMLSLLPSLGSVQELEKFSSSFFARAEKVTTLLDAASENDDTDFSQRLAREAEMLKVVLEWISGKSEEG